MGDSDERTQKKSMGAAVWENLEMDDFIERQWWLKGLHARRE